MKQSFSLDKCTLRRTFDAYNNPRLEEPEKDYLNLEHIEQLRRDSEQEWDEPTEEVVPGVGILRRIGFVTEQGYSYDTLVGIPESPNSEIPIIGTTAWTTSLRGHNEHVIRNLVKQGNYVFFVGAEGSFVTDTPPVPKSPITQANSAAAVLNFSYHIGQELIKAGHIIDPELRDIFGESRGGMVGEGIDALAPEFGQQIVASDQVAPCFPKKIESFAELLHAIEQLGKEPLEITKLIGSLTVSRLIHYRKTVDLRPSSVRDQLIIVGALVNGETGELAKRTSGSTLKHITVFENDSISMRRVWESIYEQNKMTRITPLPGSHMTIGDLETLEYVLARNKAKQLCEARGLPLTPDSVYGLSHLIIERKRQQKKSESQKKKLGFVVLNNELQAA